MAGVLGAATGPEGDAATIPTPAPPGEPGLRRIVWLAPLLVPVVAYLHAGWSRRWTVDDAFIGYRVVKQILAGNGPVFNAGERVEATTSTLWTALLVLSDLLSPFRLEWNAILIGLALGAAGLAAGMAGALRLARLRSPQAAPGLVLPIGALVYLSVAATWDWATGGLENGLALGWLGTTFWAVTAMVGRASPSRRRILGTAALAGLGVLVRPDFLPFAAGFAVPVGWAAWRCGGRRGVALAGLAAAGLPVAVQIFRMGYYGQLYPNTLHAKEGTRAWWGQGWEYLVNFVSPYLLVIPAAVTVAWLAASWRRGPEIPGIGTWRLVVAATEAAVLVHVVGIVRVGGDYMHGRLLHPTWFALLLPIMAVPARELRSTARAVGVTVLLGWAAWSVAAWRPPPGTLFNVATDTIPGVSAGAGRGAVSGVIVARDLTSAQSVTGGHMIVIEDMQGFLIVNSLWSESAAEPGFYDWPNEPSSVRADLDRAILSAPGVGALGYAAPLDVWVYDRHGLGDPVVARVRLDHRATPGHEKSLGPAWVAAMFVDPGAAIDPSSFARLGGVTEALLGVDLPVSVDPATFHADREAAAAALECGELGDLVDNARSPLTPGRFLGNIVDALRLNDLRFPVDPQQARAELCG